MTIRTWVIWKKNRCLIYGLPILFISSCIGSAAITALFLQSLRCQHWVFQILFLTTGCLPLHPLCYSIQWTLVHMLGVTWYKVVPSQSALGFFFSSIIQVRVGTMQNLIFWKNVYTQVMLILMTIPAWRVCELLQHWFALTIFRLVFSDRSQDRFHLLEVVHRDGQSNLFTLFLLIF